MSRAVRTVAVLFTFLAAAAAAPARAHCDALDGPVVNDARRALSAGDPAAVLPWVREADEREIRAAFERTLAVRKLGGEASALADTWFFETLVRVHRASEGAPFTGLAPAGRDLGPAIPAADEALETGKLLPVAKLVERELHSGLHARFERAVAAKKQAATGVEAGRRFVAAYVDYVHYVEGLHAAAARASGHHGEATAEAHAH